MAEYCRDKLSQYKISGQSKPFVDKNLQFQIPGCDFQQDESLSSLNPIYAHYFSSFQSSYDSLINESELYQAMKDAEQSYDAWKQMQERLKEVTKEYQS